MGGLWSAETPRAAWYVTVNTDSRRPSLSSSVVIDADDPLHAGVFVLGSQEGHVGTGPAVDPVATGAGVEPVVTAAAVEHVVAGAPGEDVLALAAVEVVGAASRRRSRTRRPQCPGAAVSSSATASAASA